ncbi:hypothetical protein EVAR_23066_1 [Eumeta japonica]|uniref:Uncharacterized protein n=1 Tax=Eumeta variegata TaxID=151549 RepID=A0A4C1VM94_EUMVA|nr:hypothetical protein EVAR_23066_1 [Eumeta japonica]
MDYLPRARGRWRRARDPPAQLFSKTLEINVMRLDVPVVFLIWITVTLLSLSLALAFHAGSVLYFGPGSALGSGSRFAFSSDTATSHNSALYQQDFRWLTIHHPTHLSTAHSFLRQITYSYQRGNIAVTALR